MRFRGLADFVVTTDGGEIAACPLAGTGWERRNVPDESVESEAGELPLPAIFVLAPQTESGSSSVALSRLSQREACMALVANSFQLDVTDRGRVARLLSSAAKVGRLVSAFRLAYPRDFALLPSVRDAILGHSVELTGSDTAIATAG